MGTKKMSTVDMIHVILKSLVYVCGHEQELDNAILLETEKGLAQAVRSIRSSIVARERGCVAIAPRD